MVISLHSTMFLLIREPLRNIISAPTFFTFHNVSINTVGTIKTGQNDPDFTFHNVSINTAVVDSVKLADYCFTFHNVSINTEN